MTRRPVLSGLLVAALLAGVGLVAVGWWRAVPAALRDHVDGIDVDAVPDHALLGSVGVALPEPATVVLTASSGGHELVVRTDAGPGDVRIPLIGLRADRTYDLALAVDDVAARIGTFRTRPLPVEDLPPVEVDVRDPDRVTPGWTLFNSIYRPPVVGAPNDGKGHLTIVDETGEVVWYWTGRTPTQDARMVDDGSLLVQLDETSAVRIDVATADVTRLWLGGSPGTPRDDVLADAGAADVVPLEAFAIHHELLPTADGHLVTLSRVTDHVDWPGGLCEGTPPGEPEFVVGDSVVVFDPDTGETLEELSQFDVLDPTEDPRLNLDDWCTAGYLNRHWPDESPRDWTHANAVVPMDDGRTWLVSNRHLDELTALRAVDEPEGPAGSVRWRLGPDGDFDLAPGGRWFFHPHAPEVQEDGSILLYDNGNARDDAPAPYSRAVRYELDLDTMTATQVWEHVPDDRIYANFVGDADRLDGTVLIDHGGLQPTCEAEEAEPGTTYLATRIIEVDEATGDELLRITTDAADTCEGWASYRAERLTTLYPPGFEATVRG